MRKDDWELMLTLQQYPNLTKAASMLYLSQPALTKRLQQIETEYGVAIVNRNSKGVTFTPEGEYLVGQAQKFTALQQETRNFLEGMKDGDVGMIKIGSPTSFTRVELPRILGQYQAKFPKVELRVQVAVSGEIPKLVQSQEIHVGFVNGDQQHDEERFLCSIGQGHIVSKEDIPFEELPRHPMIRFYRDNYSRKLVGDWWKSYFQEPYQIGMEVTDIDTCREMLRNGLGFSVIYSNYLREGDDEFHKLPMVFADGRPLIRNTWMVYRKNYRETPIIRNFVDYIIESMTPYVQEQLRLLELAQEGRGAPVMDGHK